MSASQPSAARSITSGSALRQGHEIGPRVVRRSDRQLGALRPGRRAPSAHAPARARGCRARPARPRRRGRGARSRPPPDDVASNACPGASSATQRRAPARSSARRRCAAPGPTARSSSGSGGAPRASSTTAASMPLIVRGGSGPGYGVAGAVSASAVSSGAAMPPDGIGRGRVRRRRIGRRRGRLGRGRRGGVGLRGRGRRGLLVGRRRGIGRRRRGIGRRRRGGRRGRIGRRLRGGRLGGRRASRAPAAVIGSGAAVGSPPCSIVTASVTPSLLLSRLPSGTPSSLAVFCGSVAMRNSTRFGTPSPSLSFAASLNLRGFRPLFSSQASGMPSLSVSALYGFVPRRCSAAVVMPSPSGSAEPPATAPPLPGATAPPGERTSLAGVRREPARRGVVRSSATRSAAEKVTGASPATRPPEAVRSGARPPPDVGPRGVRGVGNDEALGDGRARLRPGVEAQDPVVQGGEAAPDHEAPGGDAECGEQAGLGTALDARISRLGG